MGKKAKIPKMKKRGIWESAEPRLNSLPLSKVLGENAWIESEVIT